MNINFGKAIMAGFIATIVLSLLMVLKTVIGLMPQMNVIKMLARMLGTGPLGGWLAHFVIGSIAWGIGFVVLFRFLPGKAPWLKGAIFAIGAWVLMMLIIMPMAGAGLFGVHLGIMAPIMTLVLHIVFGVVMGAVYGRPPAAA